jgi:flagellar basal-body rod protein FlgB
MKNALTSAFSLHERAVLLREQRARLLAENLANAETPHYKARDFDFRAALEGAEGGAHLLRVTHTRHLAAGGQLSGGAELLYRVPGQPSIDGNTVDLQAERASFLDNALRQEASLQFLDRRIKGLMSAIRGE